MAYVSNMKFEVNSDAIVLGLINGEIQARMECMSRSSGNPEKYRNSLRRYADAGIVNSTPSIVEFMKRNPRVFRNPKLISRSGNIFEEFVTLSPLSENSDYDEKLKSRMTIGHELTTEEMEGIDGFLADFHTLADKSDVQEKIDETKTYRRSIERLWRANEKGILEHVQGILGYVPENVGKVSTFIMYPNYDTHRSYQLSGNRTNYFLAKRGNELEHRILSDLAHQAVHQPMIPYKISMSKTEKEKLHSFIKFLTNKEVYTMLSGVSGLAITTPKEDFELMGKVYPYWLGYKHRRDVREGLDPVSEIAKEIQRDKGYYDSLPEGSRAKKRLSHYQFDTLDPEKIAGFFRYKKGITPYEFIKIDFDNRDAVSKGSKKKAKKERDEEVK